MTASSPLALERVRIAAGVMCGTSADGIDAVLAEIEDLPLSDCDRSGRSGPAAAAIPERRRARLLAHQHIPFDPEFRFRLLALSRPERCCLADVALLHAELGHRFADAVELARRQTGSAGQRLAIIGSPGYTAAHVTDRLTSGSEAHSPLRDHSAVSLSLGDGDILATRTGTPVLCDMRAADRALGGHGAPLVPWADAVLLRGLALQITAPVVALNIGGIANLTVVPPFGPPFACDTGPGNMLLDLAISEATQGRIPFDAGGDLALGGRVDRQVLDQLIETDAFLAQPPPKSTGRDRYGAAYLAMHADKLESLPLADRLATLAALTAEGVVLTLRALVSEPPGKVIVSGGGAFNRALMGRLAERLAPCPVTDSQSELALHPQAREAMAFALMADAASRAEPCTVPSATGARAPAVLGKLCRPGADPRFR